MKFEPVTIKDIAKALGFSTSTVSRALRDSHEISGDTKKAVLAYADQVNYRPNPIAQNLKDRRSKSIGVMVSEIANSFFSQVIDGIESVAYNNGYHVIIAQTHELLEKEKEAMNYLASRSVDGIVMSLSGETANIEHLMYLHKMGMPFVFFDRVTDKIDTYRVSSDNVKAAYEGTMHLLENGFKRVAFLGNAPHLSIVRDRRSGYERAIEKMQLPVDENLTGYCEHGGLVYEEVAGEMNRLLQLPDPADAVLACSDKITTNVFRYCKSNNVAVPHQVGIVGFSNLDLTEYLEPSLSIIRQKAFEMGEMAASSMIHLLESKRPIYQFETKILEPELYKRSSSARVQVSLS
ncbi:MAG: LacI family DNA-binding transcriptional regulator [Edaphocola sp.]